MRILSLAPSNTEILYALGLGDQIVGVTSYCDYPKDAMTKPKVGSWITQTTCVIKDIKPDLIFTCYYLPPELAEWKGPGVVVHVNPRTINDIYQNILTIGHKTGTTSMAERLVAKMQDDIAELKKKNSAKNSKNLQKNSGTSPNLPNTPTLPNFAAEIYMEEWPSPPMASGNWVPEMVEIAGGIPIIARTGQPSGEFPFQTLQRENPDLMIFHWCGFGTRWNKGVVLARPGWADLKAVKNNRLFTIDDSLINRPGPRIIEGIKAIKEVIENLY